MFSFCILGLTPVTNLLFARQEKKTYSCLLLFSTEKTAYGFRTTWEWTNDDRFFILGEQIL